MTTTDITQAQEARVPSLGLSTEPGLHGELDQDDVVLPICAITQPTSASERGEPGMFWFNNNRSVKEMEVVVLDVMGTRTLWAPKGKSSIDGILCRSADRRDGIARYPSVSLSAEPAKVKGAELDQQYISCNRCPHYNDDQYADEDYLCKKGYTLLMAERETGGAFLYYVKGSAMKPVIRSIVSPAIARTQRKPAEPAAPWLNPFHWKPLITENQKGKWYVPVITSLPPFEAKDAKFYAEMAGRMSGRAAEQMEAEDLEEVDPEQAPLAES